MSRHCHLVTWIIIARVIAGGIIGGGPVLIWASDQKDHLRVAYFSQDVAGIDPLSDTFDPDSYAVISQIFDSLLYLDLDGQFHPGLATGWRRSTPTQWIFTLRRGVRFHNGEPFDARAVKFTYEAAITPGMGAGTAYILNTIRKVEIDPGNLYRVTIHTHHPDGMFLHRFSMFGAICPPGYIKRVGLEKFSRHPVGTGPYRFEEWKKNTYIKLARNEGYWDPKIPIIPHVTFKILPEQAWLDAFLDGRVDFVPNLAGNLTTRLMKEAKGNARILKRLVLSGYWVMLKNKGPLADRRFRQAINLAINKKMMVRLADFGNARPMASLGKKGEFGANPTLRPYPYQPDRARALLAETSVVLPVRLSAITSDVAARVAKMIQRDLESVGIHLDLLIVSRSEWNHRLRERENNKQSYDMAINLVDNPIHTLAFHAGLFLHSASPWALLRDPEFDRRFIAALRTIEPVEHRRRLSELDRYIHEEALMLFTTQRVITAAVRADLQIPEFSLNGHLDYLVLTTAAFRELP